MICSLAHAHPLCVRTEPSVMARVGLRLPHLKRLHASPRGLAKWGALVSVPHQRLWLTPSPQHSDPGSRTPETHTWSVNQNKLVNYLFVMVSLYSMSRSAPARLPASTNLVPVLTASAPAPTRLGPVLYDSGSGSDFFMHSIVFSSEIEMNSVINSVPESAPGPKIGSGSGPSSSPGPGRTETVTCSISLYVRHKYMRTGSCVVCILLSFKGRNHVRILSKCKILVSFLDQNCMFS